MHNVTTGIIFTSNSGKLSIPKAIRLYPANGCSSCDPKEFVLEGRATSTGPWVEVESGVLPSIKERNAGRIPIASTYASADPALHSTEVHFHGNSDAYLDYKLTVTP